MIEYEIIRLNENYAIYRDRRAILTAKVRYGWWSKFETIIFENDKLVFHTVRKASMFKTSVAIKENNITRPDAANIHVEVVDKKVQLIIGEDIFSLTSNLWKNPGKHLYMNGLEIGQVFFTNNFNIGLDSKYRMVFFEDSDVNFYGMMVYLLNLYNITN